MKQQGNFLLLERDEFRTWLSKQTVTRKIDKLQVHHTAAPNYSTRKLIKGVAQQDHFACLEGMRNFHVNTNGWSATGQNITTFEDGKVAISLDRNLNEKPAGISGANTGMICIENIGNFDKGGDMITDAQRDTIVHLYACLSEKFNVAVDTEHIVYHAWFTATGERLNDYTPGKSSKSCPGTNFWGDGNTVQAANKNFIPQIKAELNRLKGVNSSPPLSTTDNVKVVVNDKLVAYGKNIEGHIYIPLRDLGEALGKNVSWDNEKKAAFIDGKVATDYKMVDGSTYVGVRAAAEILGGVVSWDGVTKKVYFYN